MYRLFFIAAVFLLIQSCVEVTEWEYTPGENDQLVVESIITDQAIRQEILLSRSYDAIDGQSPKVSGAVVSVSDGQEAYRFLEVADMPGTYQSEQIFAAQRNVVYQLEVDFEGGVYQAENELTSVLPLGRVLFKPIGESDSLTLAEVGSPFAINEQAMYEVDIDWTHLIAGDSSRAKLYFYTLSTIDVNELFRPGREAVVFPKGSFVYIKKHSLNDEMAEYYRSLLMETEWQGGVFDAASGSLPTNISNGGLGFFGVSAVLCDTLIAE